jgi:ribonuclease P protein component
VRFGKSRRLLRRSEFLAVQERGAKLAAREYAVISLDRPGPPARLGVTVSSKVAKAVVRNRVKRWVRQAFGEVADGLPPVDLLVVARREAVAAGLEGARRALGAAARALASGRP